jgi:rhodanese-related sulfurtransferase
MGREGKRIAMISDRKVALALSVSLIIILGLLPLLIYWLSIGSAEGIGVADAAALLNAPGSDVVLIDVRSAAEYGISHIEGSVSWPEESIQAIVFKADIPEQLRDRTLLFICEGGVESADAVRKLAGLGLANVFSIRGGLQSWIANAAVLGSSPISKMRLASGEITPLPSRELPLFEQGAAALSGFFIKPIYMLLSLGLIILLWHSGSLDLAALRWGVILFLIGETVCWINFPIFHEEYPSLEYIHSFAMVLSIGFITFAAIEGMDHRVFKFSDPKGKCVFLGLCRGCAKYEDAPCGLNRVFEMGILALIILSVMPLNANPLAISYDTQIFGLFLNYTHPVVNQLYEIRFAPLAAILLFSASFITLQFGRRDYLLLSKILFAAGVGHLAFALMRLALLAFYRDDLVWFAFWEEATELILIAGIGYVLWVFRKGLALPLPV